MNLQQLETAIAVAETGSFSKGAARLYLSQPHVSSSIKSLEQELGYPIFWRTRSGVALTELGEQFMDHARIIVEHMETVQDLQFTRPTVRLRLAASRYMPIVNAFLRFCEEFQTSPQPVLSLEGLDVATAFRNIYQLQIDAAAMLFSEKGREVAEQLAQSYHIKMTFIHLIPMYLNLREDHPLLQSGKVELSRLSQYPFVDYVSSTSTADIVNQLSEREEQIQYSYRIMVDDRDLRCRIVSTTNAFSVGCKLPNAYLKSLNIVSFPLNIEPLHLCAAFRESEYGSAVNQRFLQLLAEEVSEIEIPHV